MSNVGKWDGWYSHDRRDTPVPYADSKSYDMGAAWLRSCSLVEDWGCGRGWMSRLVPEGGYRGVDGSQSPWADEIVDLSEYRSSVPGVFMRHVLEHNWDWRAILHNAVSSFEERMALILFTPFALDGYAVDLEPDAALEGVPTLSLPPRVIERIIADGGASHCMRVIPSSAAYGMEIVYLLSRP